MYWIPWILHSFRSSPRSSSMDAASHGVVLRVIILILMLLLCNFRSLACEGQHSSRNAQRARQLSNPVDRPAEVFRMQAVGGNYVGQLGMDPTVDPNVEAVLVQDLGGIKRVLHPFETIRELCAYDQEFAIITSLDRVLLSGTLKIALQFTLALRPSQLVLDATTMFRSKMAPGEVAKTLVCGSNHRHLILITNFNRLLAVGENSYGALLYKSNRDDYSITGVNDLLAGKPFDGRPIKAVGSSVHHTLIVFEDGYVVSAGTESAGLGRPSSATDDADDGRLDYLNSTWLQVPPFQGNIVDVIMHDSMRFLLHRDRRTLTAFGQGSLEFEGIKVDGAQGATFVPSWLSSSDTLQGYCADRHICLLSSSEEVRCSASSNWYGEVGIAPFLQTEADFNGSSWKWEWHTPNWPAGYSIIDDPPKLVRCGFHNAAVVTRSGRLIWWGHNMAGELKVSPVELLVVVPHFADLDLWPGEAVSDVQLGQMYSHVKTTLGRLLTFGANELGQLSRTAGYKLEDWTQIPLTDTLRINPNETFRSVELVVDHSFIQTDQRVLGGGDGKRSDSLQIPALWKAASRFARNPMSPAITPPSAIGLPYSPRDTAIVSTTSGIPLEAGEPVEAATVINLNAANDMTALLLDDNSVHTSGFTESGQLCRNTDTGAAELGSQARPVEWLTTGDHPLRDGERLVQWDTGTSVHVGLSNQGRVFTCGRHTDGDPVSWRAVMQREIVLRPTSHRRAKYNTAVGVADLSALGDATVVSVSAGFGHVVVLTQDGRIATWGEANNEAKCHKSNGVEFIKAPELRPGEYFRVASATPVLTAGITNFDRLFLCGIPFRQFSALDATFRLGDSPNTELMYIPLDTWLNASMCRNSANDLYPERWHDKIQKVVGSTKTIGVITSHGRLYIAGENLYNSVGRASEGDACRTLQGPTDLSCQPGVTGVTSEDSAGVQDTPLLKMHERCFQPYTSTWDKPRPLGLALGGTGSLAITYHGEAAKPKLLSKPVIDLQQSEHRVTFRSAFQHQDLAVMCRVQESRDASKRASAAPLVAFVSGSMLSNGKHECPLPKSAVIGRPMVLQIHIAFDVLQDNFTLFAPAWSAPTYISALNCPLGFQLEVADGLELCEPCPIGTYASATGGCVDCRLGLSTVATGTVSENGCVCDPNLVGNGARCVDDELLCPGGTMLIRVNRINKCEPCGLSYFRPATSGPIAACQPCPAGSFTPNASATECTLCPTGKHSDAGADGCAWCPKGRYRLGKLPASDTQLELLQQGHRYAVDTASAGSCSICPVGRYRPLADSPSLCEPCPSGQFCSSGAPQVCGTGQVCSTGAACAVSCPRGHVCPTAQSMNVCPPGVKCPIASSEASQTCDPSTFAPAGALSCLPCRGATGGILCKAGFLAVQPGWWLNSRTSGALLFLRELQVVGEACYDLSPQGTQILNQFVQERLERLSAAVEPCPMKVACHGLDLGYWAVVAGGVPFEEQFVETYLTCNHTVGTGISDGDQHRVKTEACHNILGISDALTGQQGPGVATNSNATASQLPIGTPVSTSDLEVMASVANTVQCRSGFRGSLCGACDQGYSAFGRSCLAAPPQWLGALVGTLGVVLIVFLFTGALYSARIQPSHGSVGVRVAKFQLMLPTFKSFVLSAQLLSSLQFVGYQAAAHVAFPVALLDIVSGYFIAPLWWMPSHGAEFTFAVTMVVSCGVIAFLGSIALSIPAVHTKAQNGLVATSVWCVLSLLAYPWMVLASRCIPAAVGVGSGSLRESLVLWWYPSASDPALPESLEQGTLYSIWALSVPFALVGVTACMLVVPIVILAATNQPADALHLPKSFAPASAVNASSTTTAAVARVVQSTGQRLWRWSAAGVPLLWLADRDLRATEGQQLSWEVRGWDAICLWRNAWCIAISIWAPSSAVQATLLGSMIVAHLVYAAAYWERWSHHRDLLVQEVLSWAAFWGLLEASRWHDALQRRSDNILQSNAEAAVWSLLQGERTSFPRLASNTTVRGVRYNIALDNSVYADPARAWLRAMLEPVSFTSNVHGISELSDDVLHGMSTFMSVVGLSCLVAWLLCTGVLLVLRARSGAAKRVTSQLKQ